MGKMDKIVNGTSGHFIYQSSQYALSKLSHRREFMLIDSPTIPLDSPITGALVLRPADRSAHHSEDAGLEPALMSRVYHQGVESASIVPQGTITALTKSPLASTFEMDDASTCAPTATSCGLFSMLSLRARHKRSHSSGTKSLLHESCKHWTDEERRESLYGEHKSHGLFHACVTGIYRGVRAKARRIQPY